MMADEKNLKRAKGRVLPSRGDTMPYPRVVVDDCPHCHRRHEHGLKDADGGEITREADCGAGYVIEF